MIKETSHIKTGLFLGALVLFVTTGCGSKSEDSSANTSAENAEAVTLESSAVEDESSAEEATITAVAGTTEEDASDDIGNNVSDSDVVFDDPEDDPEEDAIDEVTTEDVAEDDDEEVAEELLTPYVDYAANYNTELISQYTTDSNDVGGFFNADFSADTDISYSEGESVDWAYSHNKRKYPVDECYIRISSTPITRHWWGKENKFSVYYIFTGTENCDVEIYSGTATRVDTDDYNTVIYQKALSPLKEKNAEAQTVVFKLTPEQQGSLRVDVVYDASVDAIFDDSSTIDFRQ